MQNHFRELKDLLFIDVETAPCQAAFDQLGEPLQKLWARKASRLDPEKSASALYTEQAALFPEFGKIIALGAGYFHQTPEGDLQFRVKAFVEAEEAEVLHSFKKLIEDRFDQKKIRFVAHNGKEFDYPYLCKRMLINGIRLPRSLHLYNMRPWNVDHLDTMDMWHFGQSRGRYSLELLSAIFGLPSPKEKTKGADVPAIYHAGGQMERIAEYCRGDVVATARIYLKMRVFPDLADEQIKVV